MNGAVVAPARDGSNAQVFYPRPGGSLVTTATDETGLFIAVGGAGAGEKYAASASNLSGSGVAANTRMVVFSLAITVE